MRNGLHALGAIALALAAPQWALSQTLSFVPPPPGTAVAPLDIPAHVAPPAIERGVKPAGRRIINTTSAQIDYRYDTVGPSGIGKVEVYMTVDRGVSWTKLGDDADKQSPANVKLPGEGVFGIRLAITNGNGFGGRPPQLGDQPQLFVEVDSSAPYVALQPAAIVPNIGAIDIRWTAKDANLTAEPVTITYRTRPDASWQPIAHNIKNDGVYRWALPRDLAAQLYLRIEVADMAGNISKAESPTPILLDQTELEATVVDVTPIPRGQPRIVAPVSAPGPSGTTPTSLPVAAAATRLLPTAAPSPEAMPPMALPPALPASLPALPAPPPLPQ
jgi:hypothetical protein